MSDKLSQWRNALVCTVVFGCMAAAAQDSTPTEQFNALQKEFQQAAYAHFQTTNDAERQQTTARVDKLTRKCLELAEKNPNAPFALDAMVMVVTQEYWLNTHTLHPGWGNQSPQARAIALILRHYLDSDKLGEACKRVHSGFRQECETFLRTVLEKNPHREVQALACLRLAQFLLERLDRLDLLEGQPELARRYETVFGNDYIERLRRQDRGAVIKEAESLYQRASQEYGDVKIPDDVTVGERARTELFEIRHLAVGKVAPDIEGEDQDGREFKLSDYRGKVVLLYFWSEF